MLINPKGPPYYIFWHLSHILREKIRCFFFIKTHVFLFPPCWGKKWFPSLRFKNIALYPNFRLYLRSELRFTEETVIRKKSALIVPGRYIRTFDVIYEKLRFIDKEAEIRNFCALCEFWYFKTCELKNLYEHFFQVTKYHLTVTCLLLVWLMVFTLKHPDRIFKSLRFLSLERVADLRRCRLGQVRKTILSQRWGKRG